VSTICIRRALLHGRNHCRCRRRRGVNVRSLAQEVLFCGAIFAGGCAYWIALVLLLNRWRAALGSRMMRLNRASSVLMLVAAAATLVSLARLN
jgi:hypothetical protein